MRKAAWRRTMPPSGEAQKQEYPDTDRWAAAVKKEGAPKRPSRLRKPKEYGFMRAARPRL
jgi:hypothetical protein